MSAPVEGVEKVYKDLTASPGVLLFWHGLFMVMTVYVVARGVKQGLEWAVKLMMPALFLLLLLLVGYAALATDQFQASLTFLFRPDFSKLRVEGVLTAMGQAFFTLSLGMGAMVAYGSYLPRHISIAQAAITVSAADTLVALLAGIAIFPLVFAHGLAPDKGLSLVFHTLPLAFGQMPGGTIFGTLFFLLLVFAAWTSSISILEPLVEWLEEYQGIRRSVAAAVGGLAAWLLGIASVFSFNLWSEAKFLGKTPLDLLDYLANNIMLPLGGLLLAVFAGWIMARPSTQEELEMGNGAGYRLWRFLVRYITPLGILIVFLYNIWPDRNA
jgi:NSS family neurotransmitter:Na+ symporter